MDMWMQICGYVYVVMGICIYYVASARLAWIRSAMQPLLVLDRDAAYARPIVRSGADAFAGVQSGGYRWR